MRSHSNRPLVAIISLGVVASAAFGVARTASPEDARGALLLGAAILTVVLHAGLLLAQRRLHW
jgi:hypothetical protein